MPCSGGRFKPAPNEPVLLGNQKYVVQPHPGAPAAPFSAEGRRAVVFGVTGPSKDVWALKVFKPKFRNPSLLESASLVGRFKHLPGMLAARRTVIGPSDRAALDCPDLLYSALMPWIGGSTWNDILMKAEHGGPMYRIDVALTLCTKFLEVMKALEKEGVAHTDIAPGNVIMNLQTLDVQLLDLEDLYVPGSKPPQPQNTGSAGYRHPNADQGKTTWCAEGDRYSTAVMAAEILLLSNPALGKQINDNGFFGGDRNTPSATLRFNSTYPFLQSVAPDFAILFKVAWMSSSLEKCPRVAELLAAISKVPTPQPQPQIPGVSWQPLTTQGQIKATPSSSSVAPVSWSKSIPVVATGRAPSPGQGTHSQQKTGARRSGLRPIHWALIAAALLVLVLVIAGFVSSNNHAELEQQRIENLRVQATKAESVREQQEAERRRQAEQSESRKQYEAKYEQWLIAQRARMAPNEVTVQVQNGCANYPLDLVVRFKVPDNSGHWVTLGWWQVKPGESVRPLIATSNGNIYFYGESKTATWDGKSSSDGTSTEVVDEPFVHEDGKKLEGTNITTVSMFRKAYSSFGEHSLRLTCFSQR